LVKDIMAKSLIVTSTVPGRQRGGEKFTGATSFPLDHFSAEQLKEIAADHVLTIVVGDVLELDGIDAFVAGVEKASAKTAAKA
jgi:hypothetical protein